MRGTVALTDRQVAQYGEDGFLVIDDILTETEIEKLRNAVDTPVVKKSYSTNNYQEETVHTLSFTGQHPEFMKLAKHPNIINCIKMLLGEDIQLQHSKLATKPPTKGKGEFPWHQDFAFYPHTNTDLLSVMVMLDDATPENGCMQMVKGSHNMGLLNHIEEDGLFYGRCQEKQHWSDSSKVVNIMPKAGGISIHHTLTLHGSPPNASGKARRGIVFSYRADDAYQLADGIWEDTGIIVSGERRGVVRCEAISIRLPKTKRYPDYPYGHAWNQVSKTVLKDDSFFGGQ